MSAEFPQPQPVQQPPYMQPGMQPGTGYYPAQGQPQYGPPAQGPSLASFPGQVLGLVMVITGGVLALLGLILALAADMKDYGGGGQKALFLGTAFLISGIVLLGQWLATAIQAKAHK